MTFMPRNTRLLYELHGNAFDGEKGVLGTYVPEMLVRASPSPGLLLVYTLHGQEAGFWHYGYERTVSADAVQEDGTVS